MPIPAYSAILDSEVAADAPLTTSLMTRLRDNALSMVQGGAGTPPQVQTAAIADLSVTTAKIANGAVLSAQIGSALKQGNLNTSFGTVAVPLTAASQNKQTLLGGGAFGFHPQISATINSGSPGGWRVTVCYGAPLLSVTLASYVGWETDSVWTSGQVDAVVNQTYINASPPYDLGDGEIPLFVYVLMENGTGRVAGTYVFDVPPWAYNGPTKRKNATHYMTDENGKEHGHVKDRKTGLLTPVTHAMKNVDMHLLPHPFLTIEENHTIIMLDPVSTLELHEMHLDGEPLSALLQDGRFHIDNEPLKRATPPGVTAHAFKLK